MFNFNICPPCWCLLQEVHRACYVKLSGAMYSEVKEMSPSEFSRQLFSSHSITHIKQVLISQIITYTNCFYSIRFNSDIYIRALKPEMTINVIFMSLYLCSNLERFPPNKVNSKRWVFQDIVRDMICWPFSNYSPYWIATICMGK